MLTSWKQSRTSIEYPLPGEGSAKKKKKKSRKSLAESETSNSTIAHVIGAQFVQPLLAPSSVQEESKSSSLSRSSKKRRKFNNNDIGTTSGNTISRTDDDIEPILCITSPHRVVFMDKGEAGGSIAAVNDTNLIESKSRNYVTRPGSSSRFSLCSTNTGGANGAFAGMIPPGAQYDPASNLIYAIRNGGAEVAIWTAAPSSTLPGPDDDMFDDSSKGSSNGGVNGKKMSFSRESAKKRKPHEQKGSGSAITEFVSQRLHIPGGKSAVTLTPFSIPTFADGAAGCCDDGSILVAIRFHIDDGSDQFQLLMVDGSAMTDKGASCNTPGGKKKRKSTAKSKIDDKQGGCVLLASHATVTHNADTYSVFLALKSIIMTGEKAQVAFRNHQVRIQSKSDEQTDIQIDQSTNQNLLHLESSGTEVAAKLDANAESLSIVHKKNDGQWMLTSVELPASEDGALLSSMRTFPLLVDNTNKTTVFSFGKVGPDMVAILTKSQSTKQRESCIMSLRIVDVRRRAELSSISWTEGNKTEIEEARSTTMLDGKQCCAMITNELDGSIALLTSSKENEGSLSIVFSRLEMSTSGSPNSLAASSSSSLVSALRSVAAGSPAAQAPNANTDISDQSVVDATVDQACKLLASCAHELIEHTKSITDNESVTNGKTHTSWKQVYHECCALITKAKRGKPDGNEGLINGIKGSVAESGAGTADELPKVFIEAAFKETSALLLSLDRGGASAKGLKQYQETMQEAKGILIEVLQTKLISARADYGLGQLHRGNIFSSILQACPSLSLGDIGNRTVGTLHIIDAMLDCVQDIPEGLLVSILRFVLRKIVIDDVVAYYASDSEYSKKGTRLANQYKEMKDKGDDGGERVSTRLLSEAVLDFTLKIVTYSKCNHSFLTKAMRDSINSSGEVETLLLTFAKLLKLGGACELQEDEAKFQPHQVSLSSGALHWISALTDAHMGAIVKITNEGGIVIDRIQRAVRSAMAESEFASEVREILDLITSEESAGLVTKASSTNSSSADKSIVPYSMERLAF